MVTSRVGTPQPSVRCNHVNPGSDDQVARLGRRGEAARIRQLAAKVQAADERKDVADRGALGRTKRQCCRELGARRKNLFGTSAAAVSR
jgi:hypothetical protein